METKGLSNESLEVVSTSNNTLTPSINYYEDKVRLKFIGKNNKKVVNLYVVYEITNFHGINGYSTLTMHYLELLN